MAPSATQTRRKPVIRRTFALQIVACVLCILCFIAQALTLDYYMVSQLGALWWSWVIADVVVGALFTLALIISHRYLKKDAASPDASKSVGGELPLGYVTWLVYSVILAIKIIIIFGHPYYIAQRLLEKDFFGPNTLKTTIALSAIIFFLFIETHNDAEPESVRQGYLNAVTTGATMDILDTAQLLDVLFTQQSHVLLTFEMHKAILGISFINLVLPTVLLLMFSRTRYGRGGMPGKLKLFHKFAYTLIVNVPMFVIRLILWHVKSTNISVFIIKNVLSIGFTLKDLILQCVTMATKDSPDGGDGEAAPEEIELEEAPKSPDRSHYSGISAEI